jgi:hypothetical protein
VTHHQDPAAPEARGRPGSVLIVLTLAAVLVTVLGWATWGRPGGANRGALAASAGIGTAQRPGTASTPAASSSARSPLSGLQRPPNAPLGQLAPAADDASPPVRLQVPDIGVDTSLQPLGLLADGSLQAPSQWQQAGWYAQGVTPGNTGPAVIAGHVDSVSGPAVFFRLRELARGARVVVQRRDRRTLTFVVDSVVSYPKASFPASAVYGPTPLPELRLVTCTGDFDRDKRSYVDNLVVSAHLA